MTMAKLDQVTIHFKAHIIIRRTRVSGQSICMSKSGKSEVYDYAEHTLQQERDHYLMPAAENTGFSAHDLHFIGVYFLMLLVWQI
jgi:hypothetical protein